ncbi:NUDIX hydrolase [Comamonas serinivorans]|uniref:NUDIX hydrolase n=1 Tax=Comamonas serinivorans TaxID=1082851 RepID=A0A1Y0ENS3_9BURK|nr:NUDIX hydrolase [Comamonas serinivorans]ARU04952.1 NUDIX hydrolase [Comamonas serinivorans]
MQQRDAIKFCRECGHAVTYRVPDDGDTRERAVCPNCGTVHYVNPLNVVGTVPYFGDQVLLCKRAIAPREGFWTLPAGFMELGETLAEGARRETDEEAGAQLTLGPLFTVISVPQVGQVHSFFLAELTSLDFDPGAETVEARMFKLDDIPWDELAFLTVSRTLKLFIEERQRSQFGVHCFDIRFQPRKPA